MKKQHFDKLVYIEVPYHRVELKDVTWTPYGDDPEYKEYNRSGNNGFLMGTVVKGTTTSRLLGCVSHQAWKVGEVRRFDFSPITKIHNGQYLSHTC